MKLVTWNVQWCCGLDGIVSPERIVATARQLADFDVLCLQEVAVNYPGLDGQPRHDQPALLQALLPGYQLFYGAAVDEWDGAGQRSRFGNLIATRLAPLQLQHHPLPYPADPAVSSMPRLCTVLTVQAPGLGPVRLMTTHLEYYSRGQREAQARALRQLHVDACGQAARPPQPDDAGTPFQPKPHTASAILCGDFNLGPAEPEYALLQQPFSLHGAGDQQRLWDCWTLLHPDRAHPATFRRYDQRYGKEPIACDFVFVSDSLRERVRAIAVDTATQASDHQPVTVELA